MNRLGWALCVAACALGWPRRARAADTIITLSITKCEASLVAPERLLEYARAELAPREVVPDDGQAIVQGFVAEVRLCHGTPNAALVALSSRGQRIAERVVEIADVVGDMRARTLAVALAELYSSMPPNARALAELAPPAPSAAAPAPPVAQSPPSTVGGPPTVVASGPIPPEQSTPMPRHESRTALGAGVAIRQFFRPQTTLLGPYLGFRHAPFLLELSLLTTSKSVSVGTVAVYDASLAVAYALLTGSRGVWALRARGEAGVTWVNGSAAQPQVTEDHRAQLQAAGALEFASNVPVHDTLGLDLRLQGGVARGTTATADGQSVASTAGAFVGFSAGLSFELSRSE